MNRKAALILLATLFLMAIKCLLPPADGLRRQAADFLGCREGWIQALAQRAPEGSADRRAASAGQ